MFQTITLSFLAKFIDGPQKTSRQFSNHSKVERMIIRHGHLDAMYLFVFLQNAWPSKSNRTKWISTNQIDIDQPNTHGSKNPPFALRSTRVTLVKYYTLFRFTFAAEVPC